MPPRSRTSVSLFVLAGALVAVIATMFFAPGSDPARPIAIEPAAVTPLAHEEPPTLDSDSAAAPRVVAEAVKPPVAAAMPSATPAPESKHATIRLVGTVSDPSGRRIAEARAHIQCRNSLGTKTAPILASAFRLEGLEPGNWVLESDVTGFRAQTRTITLAADEVEHREDFVLEPVWTVAIRLMTPDGRNLLDRRLVADAVRREIPRGMAFEHFEILATTDAPPDRWVPRSFEDRRARHWSRWVPLGGPDEVIPGDPDRLCAGRLEIFGPPPIHVSVLVQGFVVGSTLLESRVDRATIEIRTEDLRGLMCSLRVRAVDRMTGDPIPMARGALSGSQARPISIETDTDGLACKTDVTPGSYVLLLNAPNRSSGPVEVDLLPARENDLGRIPLDAGAKLRGHFVEPRGRSVYAMARLYQYSEDRPLDTLSTRIVIGFDVKETGAFESEGLARRKYLLVGTVAGSVAGIRGWKAPPTIVDLTNGSIEDLVVPVRDASDLVMKIESEEDRDLAYWILAPDGLLCARGNYVSPGDTHVGLFPGRFRLLVGRNPTDVREMQVQLGSEPLTISIPH